MLICQFTRHFVVMEHLFLVIIDMRGTSVALSTTLVIHAVCSLNTHGANIFRTGALWNSDLNASEGFYCVLS